MCVSNLFVDTSVNAVIRISIMHDYNLYLSVLAVVVLLMYKNVYYLLWDYNYNYIT